MNKLALILVVACACGPTLSTGDDDVDDGGNPIVDAWPDGDNDGYPGNIDCNDADPAIHPGAIELCDDEVDNDCNDLADEDDFQCMTPCQISVVEESYFGCRIYAADLPQISLGKLYGISLSNPSGAATAHVTISTSAGVLTTLEVPPKGVATYEDSSRARNIPGAGIHDLAFLIESDLPVAAYQFNHLDTINAATTDASLLFAEPSLAKLYFAMNYTSRGADDGFIAVYATEADTQVDITPTVAVSGQTSALLQPFQLMVVMAQNAGDNMTGTRINADKPIGVFGGNRCTNVPLGMSYCDHVEQQIFPRQAIGTRYVVGKTHARTHCAVDDYIRVMADVDLTTVTFDPPIAGPWNLNAGEWMETTISASVEISATQPVMVGQFLRSSNDSECADEGDPAFILQVPVDQFRGDYVFLTPPTYDTDYIDIIAPPDAVVLLDSSPVIIDPTPIATTGFSLTSMVVVDGPHRIESNQPVGVIVYGYGGPSPEHSDTQNVSYGYPAGLDLEAINPIE